MTRTHRPARLLSAATVLAAVLTLAACGDDDPTASGAEEPDNKAPSSQATGTTKKTPDAAVAGATLQIDVKGDEVTPEGKKVNLAIGDVLTIVIRSDRAGELHVHSSPEQELEFDKGESKLEVTLDKPGQVDVEEHESGVLIARLLVK